MTASPVVLSAQAAHVLGRNSDGVVVKPAAGLYPHQWSWDTAFITIALAAIDIELACANMDALFAGQWLNGMVPHIVFDINAEGYFPGPDRWACSQLSADAPSVPQTSGICQPPLHAIAAAAVLQKASLQGEESATAALTWAKALYPKLLAWHRFLARERVDDSTGLVRIFHGWESGMDNSPRFDGPYRRVQVGASLPPYRRRDLEYVHGADQRPTAEEYDRYLWLVEEAKEAGYDQGELRRSGSFNVGDVFFTAIYAAANDHLAALSRAVGAPDGPELHRYAELARAGVLARAHPSTGLTSDLDFRSGEDLAGDTIAGFAPLIAGDLPRSLQKKLVASLLGPSWCGARGLRWPLPPSTSPSSGSFRARSYWRGPVWPVMSWLLAWSLDRCDENEAAAALRRATVEQLSGGGFAEYYEPYTGEPLGTAHHSWTAAVIVDWLCK